VFLDSIDCGVAGPLVDWPDTRPLAEPDASILLKSHGGRAIVNEETASHVLGQFSEMDRKGLAASEKIKPVDLRPVDRGRNSVHDTREPQ
jgi:hypothetical protein